MKKLVRVTAIVAVAAAAGVLVFVAVHKSPTTVAPPATSTPQTSPPQTSPHQTSPHQTSPHQPPPTSAPQTEPQTAPPHTTSHYTVPSAIPDNCSSDASVALNAWLGTLPDYAAISFPRGGACYGVDNPIDLLNRNGLSLVGNGATIEMLGTTANSQSGFNIITVDGGSNISVSDMTLIGDNTSKSATGTNSVCSPAGPKEWQYGIAFNGTSVGSVTNVNIKDICGDFVEMQPFQGPAGSYQWSRPATNITISGGTFSVAGRQGMGLEDVEGATITGITMSHVGQEGIDLEDDAVGEGVVGSVALTDSSFSYIGDGVLADFGAQGGGIANGNITVSHNTQTHPVSCVPEVWGQGLNAKNPRTGFTITNNTFTPFSTMIYLKYFNNVTISGNVSKPVGNEGCGGIGIDAKYIDGAIVENNDFGPNVTRLARTSNVTRVQACGNRDATGSNLPTACAG